MDSVRANRNERDVAWEPDVSPKGRYRSFSREMSQGMQVEPPPELLGKGRHPQNRPFEVSLVRIPPGGRLCPLHVHSFQWEYYIVLAGRGRMLQSEEPIPLEAGDHVLQPPGWAHTVENDGEEELLYYVIADNPPGEIAYYPESRKWMVWPPARLFRMDELPLDETGYFDGEE